MERHRLRGLDDIGAVVAGDNQDLAKGVIRIAPHGNCRPANIAEI